MLATETNCRIPLLGGIFFIYTRRIIKHMRGIDAYIPGEQYYIERPDAYISGEIYYSGGPDEIIQRSFLRRRRFCWHLGW